MDFHESELTSSDRYMKKNHTKDSWKKSHQTSPSQGLPVQYPFTYPSVVSSDLQKLKLIFVLFDYFAILID